MTGPNLLSNVSDPAGDSIEFKMTLAVEWFGTLLSEPTVSLVLFWDQDEQALLIHSVFFDDGQGIDISRWHRAHSSWQYSSALLGWMIESIERDFRKPDVQRAAADAWREAHGDSAEIAADRAYDMAREAAE